MKRLPPHITGSTAFALVGAAVCLVFWLSRLDPIDPPHELCPPRAVLDSWVTQCVSGDEQMCDAFALVTDECLKTRLRESTQPAERIEDITV